MTELHGPTVRRLAAAVTIAIVAAVSPATAQEGLARLSYDISMPFSDTKTFVDQVPSWRGASFDLSAFITPNLAIGGAIGWHTMNYETSELISIRDAELEVVDGEPVTFNGDISGNQFRFLNSFPLMFQATYYVGDEFRSVRPYFGSGIGTMRAEERLEVGRFAVERTNWKFAITPEAGVLLRMTDDILTNVGIRYHHGFKSGQSIGADGGTHTQYLSIQVGLTFYNNLF